MTLNIPLIEISPYAGNVVVAIHVHRAVAGRVRDLISCQLLLGGMSRCNLVYPDIQIVVGNVVYCQNEWEVDDSILVQRHDRVPLLVVDLILSLHGAVHDLS